MSEKHLNCIACDDCAICKRPVISKHYDDVILDCNAPPLSKSVAKRLAIQLRGFNKHRKTITTMRSVPSLSGIPMLWYIENSIDKDGL